MTVAAAYELLYAAALFVLSILTLLCLYKAVKGPRTTDRIVAINVIGTITNTSIAILSTKLKETYLADICLIYALVSFLAVIVLTKAYLGVYKENQRRLKEEAGGGDSNE